MIESYNSGYNHSVKDYSKDSCPNFIGWEINRPVFNILYELKLQKS